LKGIGRPDIGTGKAVMVEVFASHTQRNGITRRHAGSGGKQN